MTKRSLVAVFILVGGHGAASAASAECVWVLWSREGSRAESALWTPLDTYETKSDCEKLKSVAAAEFKQRTGAYLHCWPDTLDPRGPKGGK